MFILKKVKESLQPKYEVVAKNEFTKNNLFVCYVLDVQYWSPGKYSLLEWTKKIEKDPSFSKDFYSSGFETKTEVFTFNIETKDSFKILLETSYLIEKCYRILNSDLEKESDYLINQLVGVVFLLKELDKSIRKGVPLLHDSVIKGCYTVHQLLEEKLNEYFELSTESLDLEIKIAQDLRIAYQSRKEILNMEYVK